MSNPSTREQAGPLWGVKTRYKELSSVVPDTLSKAKEVAREEYRSPFFNGPFDFELRLVDSFTTLGFAAGSLVGLNEGVDVDDDTIPTGVLELFVKSSEIGAGPFADRYMVLDPPTTDICAPRAFYCGVLAANGVDLDTAA